MRSEDAVEIVRASLALAFPTATAEGLARAADLVITWGSEEAADHLADGLALRMFADLAEVCDVDPSDVQLAEPQYRDIGPTPYRTWSRSEHMDDRVNFLPRPPDEPPPRTPRRPAAP